MPVEPAGWLLTVGRRRRGARDERYALLARDLDATSPCPDALFDPAWLHKLMESANSVMGMFATDAGGDAVHPSDVNYSA